MSKADISIIQECMTSLDLAAFTGKRHSDMLRDIREMEKSWTKHTKRRFSLSEYVDSTGRKLPMYNLEKDEILFIATKYNDELRAIMTIRFVQLEKKREQLEQERYNRLKSENDRLWDASDRDDIYRRR